MKRALLLVAVVALAACGGKKEAATLGTTNATTTVDSDGCHPIKTPSPEERRAPKPKQPLDPSKTYDVTLQTNCGSFTIRLDVNASPHRRHDVAALDADVLGCSAYKWFGPHTAMLCARPEILAEYFPDKLKPSPDEPPDRWELGTLPFESLAGVRAAAEYLLELDFEAVHAHEQRLLDTALDGLKQIDGVTVYGAARDRAPTLMFNVAGRSAAEVATALAEQEIAV